MHRIICLMVVVVTFSLLGGCRTGAEGAAERARARQEAWSVEIGVLARQQAALVSRLAERAAPSLDGGSRPFAQRLRADALVTGSGQSLIDLRREMGKAVERIAELARHDEEKAMALLVREGARMDETLTMLRTQLALAEKESAL
jgi:hypothetical protein